MDPVKALAILGFCVGANAAALPQLPGLSLPVGGSSSTASGAKAGITLPTPPVSVPGGLTIPPLPIPNLPAPVPVGIPLPNTGALPLPGGLPLPNLPTVPGSLPATPKLPVVGDLPPPAGSPGPKLPIVGNLPVPVPIPELPVPLPELPVPEFGDVASADALAKVIALGNTVFELILNILARGASLIPVPGGLPVPSGLPVPDLPVKSPLGKRQATSKTTVSTATPAAGLPLVGGLTSNIPVVGGIASTVGGATSNLPIVGGSTVGVASAGSPLSAVSGLTSGLTSGYSPVGAVAGTVSNAVGSVPVAGSAAAPVLNTVGGLAGGVTSSPSPLSGVTGTVAGVANSVPVAGPVVGGAVNNLPVVGGGSSANAANANPLPLPGIPGTDPVGAFSISVIATLLSLLKKDPLSLFGPALPIPALVKRDLPELHKAGIPELAKRQFNLLPSLSSGIPGVGVGSLPLSGLPGVPPDLAFLVGSIAKNIAVPGGSGLGSITGNILGVLNGVVPNFLFQLPVVQDSVPTFGVLQLLSSINPAKFGTLAGLTNLAALQQAASVIPAGDLAFIKSLPVSPDPSNLITTIITLSDNVLTLPGNVANLKAAVSVLCLKNLGLAVPGL